MIYGRGKWLGGAWLLVARNAARHFALIRKKTPRGHSDSWKPLVLRWRRRLSRRENLAPRHAASGPRVFSFPQFHFHFATTQIDRTRRDRVVALLRGPEIAGTRVVVDRRWSSIRSLITSSAHSADRSLRQFHSPQTSKPVRDAALISAPGLVRRNGSSIQALQANRAYAASRAFYSTVSFRHPSDSRVANTRRWLRTSGHSMVAAGASDPRPLQRIPELARGRKPSDERILFVNHSKTSQHSLQIFYRPSPGRLFSSSGKENKSQPVPFDRREELVWRVRRVSTDINTSERHQGFSNHYEQPALCSFQSNDVVRVPAHFEPPATQQITKLDPGLVDRLTDDVIRRVEQRVRIERERRGL